MTSCAEGTCQHLARRAREGAWGVWIGAWRRVKRRWWSPDLWWRVEARGCASWPEIFRSCRSKAAEDPCTVSFVKFWRGSHKFEGLSRGSFWACDCAWERVEVPWRTIFLGYVDRSPFNSPVVLVFWSEGQICANFEWLFRWSLWVRGRAWERVDSLLSLIFSGFL